jgi:hypothetical protein
MTWALRANPALNGMSPRLLVSDCHDHTPFLTIQHDCGEAMHVHESQLPQRNDETIISTRCPACSEILDIKLGFLREAFASMRREGWIA